MASPATRNNKVRELGISNMGFEEGDAKSLANALGIANNRLTVLNASGNRFRNKAAALLSQGLAIPHFKLQSLAISHDSFDAEGCKAVAASRMDTSSSRVQQRCKKFLQVLQSPRNHVCDLNVRDCAIGSSGARALASGLEIPITGLRVCDWNPTASTMMELCT